MGIADFAAVDRSARFPLGPDFQTKIRWIHARRAGCAQRNALQDLLFAPEYRPRHVGITRQELIRAIEAQGTSVRGRQHRRP